MTKTSETTKPSGKIVFFGSGPVAAESLKLLAKHAEIEAVVTKAQPPHHKSPFPVLEVAELLGLKVYTPNGKQELSELVATKPFTSELGIVIDYGFIIAKDAIDSFPLGIINSHFSILPEWRGADPISFAILSGQQKTGVSLMLIVEKLDEGDIIAHDELPLDGTETTPDLTFELIMISNALLQEYLPLYRTNPGAVVPQSNTGREASYSRKLTKEDSVLNFTKPAAQLEREIRAFIEWPKSRTSLAGKEVVITKAHAEEFRVRSSEFGEHRPGDIWKEAKTFGIYTPEGILVIDALKPAGKPEMPSSAFLAGYKF